MMAAPGAGQAAREGSGAAVTLVELVAAERRFERGGVVALESVDLEVPRGRWLAVNGPSGSGKSTLLHLLSGLDRPTRGRVLFEGLERQPREWTSIRARRIGFVFQAFHLLPTLSALENVAIPMFGLVPRAAERRRRAAESLAAVGLGARFEHRPAELSAGERQRVAIARSLANGPDLLLADEPTGNLDAAASEQVMALLADLRRARGLTLIVATHSAEIAARADEVVEIIKGRRVLAAERRLA